MVMHVKEPQPSEYELIRQGQIVFTYLHLAADEELTRALMQDRLRASPTRPSRTPDGSLPLLTPMSEVAGRMAIQEGAKYLEKAQGGRGILLGGVPGVEPGHGGGHRRRRGRHQRRQDGRGLGRQGLHPGHQPRPPALSERRHARQLLPAHVPARPRSASWLTEADLVIGAVLIPGAKAPKLVTREMLKTMKHGAVIVDVAIDQGGCFETSRPTTHADPIYVVDGVVHYCVANMPGAVADTSTLALTNATLPYALQIANKGWKQACQDNAESHARPNMVDGKITYQGVAEAFGLPYTPADSCL